jgi:hypothetical protein
MKNSENSFHSDTADYLRNLQRKRRKKKKQLVVLYVRSINPML